MYITYQDLNVEVQITDYPDMNLKGILDTAKNEEKKLEQAKVALENYKKELEQKIEKIKSDGKTERNTIRKGPGSQTKKEKLIAQQKTGEKKAIAAVQADYREKIGQKEEEVKVLAANVKKANEQVNASIDKANRYISNVDKLTTIKMKKQKDYYERRIAGLTRRYNPVFTDPELKSILKEQITAPNSTESFAPYSRGLKLEASYDEADFENLKKNNTKVVRLLGELEKVPYTNSVPPALDKIKTFHDDVVNRFNSIMNRLLDSNRAKSGEIGAYRHAFQHLTRVNPETGYVVDARNQNRIRIYVNPVIRVKKGFRAKVFRKDDELLGEIEFLSDSDGSIAKVISLETGKTIQPFDRILIKYVEE